MSIINEALKKTQKKLELTSPSPASPAPAAVEKSIWLWFFTGLIFAGFIGCGIVFVSLIYSNSWAPSPVLKKQKSEITIEAVRQKYLPTISLKDLPKQKPGEIALNGIITMGDEQFALLNNEIYRAGDYAEGRRILSITKDKVELFDKGKILVLKTKRSIGGP